MMKLMQLIQSSQNPMQILNNMFGEKIVNRAVIMLQGKTPQEQEQIVRNLAQSRGIDLNDFIQNLQRFKTP